MREIPNEQRSAAYLNATAELQRSSNLGRSLDTAAGSRSVEAWFLGTKAENAELFLSLVSAIIQDQAHWRRNFHPGDPGHITSTIKTDPTYVEAVGMIEDELHKLLAFLKKSVPFFSMRYQGHMNWDLTIPSMLGYFAAMLYNPNNVALEGSTATTLMELDVGNDLCRMLGYSVARNGEVSAGVQPWGHITCDGTVANIEALWSARNLKYYPVSIRAAIEMESQLQVAKNLEVALPGGGRRRLLDLSEWELLNLTTDTILELPTRLSSEFKISEQVVTNLVGAHLLQRVGMAEFHRNYLKEIKVDPVVCVPGTKHYSFPKAMAVLGLGSRSLVDQPVDLDARMDVAALEQYLEGCLKDRRPVIAVVAVIGTTEESAIDPLAKIAELRDKFAARGLVFHLHADAAWGGYHRSVINEEFEFEAANTTFVGGGGPSINVPLSDYSVTNLKALTWADSITVDPHKSGYIPYPAGALCYRNGAQRHLVAFSAPVVFRGKAEQTVGIYGIEGSKPGAAVSAVYLSHKIIRPTKSGYGQIIGQALYSCRKYYARLLTMATPEDPFFVVPLPRLPAERAGRSVDDIQKQKRNVANLIDRKSNDEIRNNPEAMTLLREIGPDQNILAYVFNFRRQDGSVNTELNLANKLNLGLYEQLSIKYGDDIYHYRLLVSSTDIEEATYGKAFVDHLKQRMGITSGGSRITVIRSVVMDPWITETGKVSFVDTLEQELRAALSQVLQTIPESIRSLGGY